MAWNTIGVDHTGSHTSKPVGQAPMEISDSVVESGGDTSVVSVLRTCELEAKQ